MMPYSVTNPQRINDFGPGKRHKYELPGDCVDAQWQ